MSEIDVFVNTTISFRNQTGATVTVAGTGIETFEHEIENEKTAPSEVRRRGRDHRDRRRRGRDADRHRRASASPAVRRQLRPLPRGRGRWAASALGGSEPALARAWPPSGPQTGGQQSLNNYVSWVITLGGVVRSGNIDSLMPAWGQDFGGTLTRQQIEALTAMIGEWAQETLDNPPPSPSRGADTVEAGAEVYATVGCVGCHGAEPRGRDRAQHPDHRQLARDRGADDRDPRHRPDAGRLRRGPARLPRDLDPDVIGLQRREPHRHAGVRRDRAQRLAAPGPDHVPPEGDHDQ